MRRYLVLDIGFLRMRNLGILEDSVPDLRVHVVKDRKNPELRSLSVLSQFVLAAIA
jgi:hypothetical protein